MVIQTCSIRFSLIQIPHDSILYADGAYNCFDLEDLLKDGHIQLAAKRGTKGKGFEVSRCGTYTSWQGITLALDAYARMDTSNPF